MPVPIAVAPMFTSCSSASASRSRCTSSRSVTANALNSCPSVIGTASCSWVRPTLTMCANSRPFASNEAASSSSCSSRRCSENAIAILIAVGYVSFVDWLWLVWSFGLMNA